MGRRKQRSFEARFKEEAVRRVVSGESIMRLSRELDVARRCCIAGATPIGPRAWQVSNGDVGGRDPDSKW